MQATTREHRRSQLKRRLVPLATALAAAAVVASAWSLTAASDPATGQPPVDFWNYDSRTGEKISNFAPGVRPEALAKLWMVGAPLTAAYQSGSQPSPYAIRFDRGNAA